MLHRVIGPSGSGKTEFIMNRLGDAIESGKQCYVIVPEQQSVNYESEVCRRFGDSSNLFCEILNFERLPNRIARDFGGLVVNNIDKGGACALLSVIADSLKGSLGEYASIASNVDFAQSLFSLITRMKMAMIPPEKLFETLEEGKIEDARLVSKLKDIAIIYEEYEKQFTSELSDPHDALTRLAKELPEKPFFKDTCVFIDGYYNFTRQEYAIIEEILNQSAETYISFNTDKTRAFFEENDNAAKHIADKCRCGIEDHEFLTTKRFSTESLKYIEKNIFSNTKETLSDNDGSVEFITAKNRFEEVEAVAERILNYVRAGGRYKDIAVVTGNAEGYRPIVDAVFTRAGIPVYISAKEPLESKSLFSFVVASIAVIAENFSLRSMKKYIKSGYAGLSARESDALISYADSWKIQGKMWYGDNDWFLDPDGYSEREMDKRSVNTLALANKARRKVVEPLSVLRDNLLQKNLTVSQAVRALYEHLMQVKANEILRKKAERILKNGNREKSEREIQLWKLLINIINQLDSLCGDREVTPSRLLSLIRLMCDCYSLGAIPPSADAVTFGDASLIRAGNSAMVAVLGVCDGEFPAVSKNNSFFDRKEAITLEGVDLILADTLQKQLITNRFLVYAAFTAAKEKLLLFCPKSELTGEELRPSMAWYSAKKLLPNVKEQEFTESSMIYSAESIAANFPWIEEGDLKKRIEKALQSKKIPFYAQEPAIVQKESIINYKKDELNLSPTTFESYVSCPFSYFGRYVLDLKEKKVNEFSGREIGNAAHKMLEQFMKKCVINGSFDCPDAETRQKIINETATEYLREVIGNGAEEDKRFMHNYKKMVKLVSFIAESLCDEFSQSKFIPYGFEYGVGKRERADIPPVEYTVDGKKVFLRGSIDRVDVYECDGVKYVRVIDYKTYNKAFSLELVAEGIDTQLLHYLFAFCEKNGGTPAGMLYYNVVLPSIKIKGNETDEELKTLLIDSISRDGILLDDTDIILAMSPDCRHVPVSKTNNGIRKNKRLLSATAFDELSQSLSEHVEKLASGIFGGNMNIAPNDCGGEHDPCRFCKYSDICRSKNCKEEDDDGNEESDS